MDSLKRLGIPFSILIVCALLQRLMDTYLRGCYTQTFHTIFLCAALFFFGYFLNAKYKKISNAVMPKVFSIVVLLLLLFLQLGILQLPPLSRFLHFFGLEGIYMYMLYVFCGFVFAD